ncbi:DNA-3-methyladenine glycosylase [bacterium]|nr:DNA-3-methyladenine glycosylase [bacterium]
MRKAVLHLKANDPVIAGIIKRVGPLKPAYAEPTFESLTRAIVYQQLNGKAARTIYERFELAAGGKVTPESVLSLTEEEMRKAGLSKQKLSYIRDLAAKTKNGEVNFEQLPGLKDEDVIEHLTRVKGIGVWSAQMFLMFALRRPNVLPTGDYGIRAAIQKAYRKRTLPGPDQMIKLARKWEPYRTLACYYLWRSLDVTILSAKK